MARVLPKLSESGPVCPFAFPIAGASRATRGVVCTAMQADAAADPGLRMTPRALEVLRENPGGIYLNLKSDPSTVTGFCYGNALPRSCESDKGPRAHFTFCPVWEAWDERRREGLDGLYDHEEPEPVSMGVDEEDAGYLLPGGSHTLEAADPWAQAKADLDLLESGTYE